MFFYFWFQQGIYRFCFWIFGFRFSLVMALCLKQVFVKDKIFRSRKRFEFGIQRFELYKKVQVSFKSGLDLRSVVRLFSGENIDDWIVVYVVDFFNRINFIYGIMAERCSEISCLVMVGGFRYEYRWQDERQYRRSVKFSASRYMVLFMDWIEGFINDEDVFFTRIGECYLQAGEVWLGSLIEQFCSRGCDFYFCFVEEKIEAQRGEVFV